MTSRPKIYYLVPDSNTPSWGIGLLYHHVRLLREIGFEAWVLHRKPPFRLSWMEADAPIVYLEEASFDPQPSDFLVVPEVLACSAAEMSLPGRHVVFIQGSYLIQAGAGEAIDYLELGYEAAMAVLPHVGDIVRAYHGLEASIVPPFVADYFFVDPEASSGPRDLEILLVSKPEYRQAGYLDYEIFGALLRRHLNQSKKMDWKLIELSGLTHRETAEAMKRATFLVNLNTLEAFNTTVPEAMAAGCIAVCYDAFGGQDFLRPGVNAFVFPNNYVYSLSEELFSLIEDYDQRQTELTAVRRAAQESAGRFREGLTSQALQEFFGWLLR